MRIDARTRLITLIGHPVEHSRSPLIHNTALEEQGVNAAYVATPVAEEALDDAVAGLRALNFLGANVTTPHKQAVRPLLDAESERAAAVGAVNAIVRDEDADGEPLLRGDNTDVAGFLEPLTAPDLEMQLEGEEMLVFGAGGAARAVAYALLTTFRPTRLTIVNRTRSKAERLAGDFALHDARDALRVTKPDDAARAVRTSRLVVNATSLGMHPNTEGTPWPHADDFTEDQVVYDLVYTPEETRLLREAAARGARTIGGLTMLVEQAAAAYQQWTGQPMPVDVVYEALRSASPSAT